MSDAVTTEQVGRVLIITLNRPDQLNSINGAVASGIRDAVGRLDDDPSLTTAVVTGAGRAFCSGMDLKAFARGEDISPFLEFVRRGAMKPLIAAIEGFALGGGLELALACDLLVVAETARLGIPETKVGLFAAGGGLLRLPGRVGYSRAIEMAITARPISAEEALRYGLAARLATPGDARTVAFELAELVAQNAPLAVVASKELIRIGQDVSEVEYWERQKERYKRVFRSNDAKEGPRAFAEKRAPQWANS